MIKNFLIVFLAIFLNLILFRGVFPMMISSENDWMVWLGMFITIFVTAGQIFFFSLYFNRKG